MILTLTLTLTPMTLTLNPNDPEPDPRPLPSTTCHNVAHADPSVCACPPPIPPHPLRQPPLPWLLRLCRHLHSQLRVHACDGHDLTLAALGLTLLSRSGFGVLFS